MQLSNLVGRLGRLGLLRFLMFLVTEVASPSLLIIRPSGGGHGILRAGTVTHGFL